MGVFNEETKGFIGIRLKFNYEFLFTEYHWDTGPPFGTVRPIEILNKIPDDIELKETLGTIDLNSKKFVDFREGKWYYIDSGEPDKNILPGSLPNEKVIQIFEENGIVKTLFSGKKCLINLGLNLSLIYF